MEEGRDAELVQVFSREAEMLRLVHSQDANVRDMSEGVFTAGLERGKQCQRIDFLPESFDESLDHVIDATHVYLPMLLCGKIYLLEFIKLRGSESKQLRILFLGDLRSRLNRSLSARPVLLPCFFDSEFNFAQFDT
ncbi:MAG: hypothetical protein ACD_75C02420G0002 [uncultured bacterium]|nr:MAG: hypothetical protein ACD_75C02420G0002 [uncultured bacterium]